MLQRAFDEWNHPGRDQRNERHLTSIAANTRYIGETLELIRQLLIDGQDNDTHD